MSKQTTPEFLFEPKLLPMQLFEKFIVFNVNAGYRGKGTPHGVNLIKGNKHPFSKQRRCDEQSSSRAIQTNAFEIFQRRSLCNG